MVEQGGDHPNATRRYLLGQMPEAERIRYEENWLDDEELFADLLVVEAELIGEYARGELAPDEREAFERCFLRSAERRLRVEIARALMTAAGEEPDRAGEE